MGLFPHKSFDGAAVSCHAGRNGNAESCVSDAGESSDDESSDNYAASCDAAESDGAESCGSDAASCTAR